MKYFSILALLCALLFASVFTGACGGNDDDKKDGTPGRYETVPYLGISGKNVARSAKTEYQLVFSGVGGDKFYYVFLLGHVNRVPIVYRDAMYYDGTTSVTIGYTQTGLTDASVMKSVTDTVVNAVEQGGSVAIEAGTQVGPEFAQASVSKTMKENWSFTDTRSTSNTVETTKTKVNGSSDSYSVTIGEKGEPAGKYRYTYFATTDVYYILVTDHDKTILSGEGSFAICAREQSYTWAVDYESDSSGHFGKTGSGALLQAPVIDASALPIPTVQVGGDDGNSSAGGASSTASSDGGISASSVSFAASASGGISASSVSFAASASGGISASSVSFAASASAGISSSSVSFAASASAGISSSSSSSASSVSTEPIEVTRVKADLAALTIVYATGDSATNITQNLTLVSVGPVHGSAITWESLTPEWLADDGTVTRPPFTPGATGTSGNKTVSIRATAVLGDASGNKTFPDLKIVQVAPTDADKVAHEKALLTDGSITYGWEEVGKRDTAGSVTQNLGLGGAYPNARAEGMEYKNVAIVWTSDKPDVISINGTVTRPEFAAGDATVKLTATLTYGAEIDTRVYTLTVKAKLDPDAFHPVFFNSNFERNGVSIPNNTNGSEGSGIVPGTVQTLSWSTNEFYGGTRSLHVSSNSGNNRSLFSSYGNCYPADGRTKIVFWIKGTGIGTNGGIFIQTGPNGTTARYWSFYHKENSGPDEYTIASALYGDYAGGFTFENWTKIILNLPASYDPSSVGKIDVRGGNNGKYDFYIDEIGYEP